MGEARSKAKPERYEIWLRTKDKNIKARKKTRAREMQKLDKGKMLERMAKLERCKRRKSRKKGKNQKNCEIWLRTKPKSDSMR